MVARRQCWQPNLSFVAFTILLPQPHSLTQWPTRTNVDDPLPAVALAGTDASPLVGHIGKPSAGGGHDGVVCPRANISAVDICPGQCKFVAEVYTEICRFWCVTAADCGTGVLDPNAIVADANDNYCRRCRVPGCWRCSVSTEGGQDRCADCSVGYQLFGDGQCRSRLRHGWTILKVCGLTASVFLFAWYVRTRCRPVVNEVGLNQAIRARELTQLRAPELDRSARHGMGTGVRNFSRLSNPWLSEQSTEETRCSTALRSPATGNTGLARSPAGAQHIRSLGVVRTKNLRHKLYPMNTNLLAVPIAGPGTVLHFNFQLSAIIWAVAMITSWSCMAILVEPELLALGTKPAKTPQQFCNVIATGRETQMRLLVIQVVYIWLAYLATFAGAIAYAVCQHRRYADMDSKETTMSDFSALVEGLPRMHGTDDVEYRTRELLEGLGGEPLIGVSVCWDFRRSVVEVMDAIAQDIGEVDTPTYQCNSSARPSMCTFEPPPVAQGRHRVLGLAVCRVFEAAFRAVDRVLGLRMVEAKGNGCSSRGERERIKEVLRNLETSGSAFAVFRTESSRDRAITKVREARSKVRFSKRDCEPDTVRWNSFGFDHQDRIRRVCMGVGISAFALVGWVVIFYLPYAWYMVRFQYSQGDLPSGEASLVFSMLVACGNQIMYIICMEVSQQVGFTSEDRREVFYTGLYLCACMINMVLDLGVACIIQYQQMAMTGVRTADGNFLTELEQYQDLVESYPMQKALGERIFAYSFPACFLLPFILEAIFVVYLPYHVKSLVIRANADVRGQVADKFLLMKAMDLSRYADILLNLTLSSCVFFCASAYNLLILLTFVASHIYIYAYDHYRVLRLVPRFNYASDVVERFAQGFMAVPCGVMLSCAIFRQHQWLVGEGLIGGILSDAGLLGLCIVAFLVHVGVHCLLLVCVVPRLVGCCGGHQEHKRSKTLYMDLAQRIACSWFSANPVHCLRSKHILGDAPPCTFHVYGKEYLQDANPSIGTFFTERASCQNDALDDDGAGIELQSFK